MLTLSKALKQCYMQRTAFSMAFFKSEPQATKYKRQRPERGSVPSPKFTQSQAEAIDNVNKYFEGIRMNTKYEKFYNEEHFSKLSPTTTKRLSDLPFNPSPLTVEINPPRINKITSHILSKIPEYKLVQKLKQMSKLYFQDLVSKERRVKIYPNFEKEARLTMMSLSKDGNFALENEKKDFELHIQSVLLYKGIEVTRNNNYSVDSYEVVKEEGYLYYKLWQRGVYKIPETYWFHQQNMLIRINALVELPFDIVVPKAEKKIGGEKLYSNFVFEMDLKHPPRFSSFHFKPQYHIKMYEPVLDNLTITNVDNRNSYFAFTFEYYEKKEKLINKLI